MMDVFVQVSDKEDLLNDNLSLNKLDISIKDFHSQQEFYLDFVKPATHKAAALKMSFHDRAPKTVDLMVKFMNQVNQE